MHDDNQKWKRVRTLKVLYFEEDPRGQIRCDAEFDGRCRYNNGETSVRHRLLVERGVMRFKKHGSILATFVLSFPCGTSLCVPGVFPGPNA